MKAMLIVDNLEKKMYFYMFLSPESDNTHIFDKFDD